MSDVSPQDADNRHGSGSQPGPPEGVSPGSRTTGHWLPPSTEELQAQFPQYRIDELIGCGGMGAVYKGWQTLLERFVAIKILPPDVVTGDAQFTTRFKQEAKTMARFQHPGIVSIYDAGETPGGLLYIVMEFIEGTDVAHMLTAQGKLSSEYSLAIAAHVSDALQYAHSHGVIHRDIKPANVLINMEGAVKVGDFGLAKATDLPHAGLTRGDMTMGTPDFVAPEALISGIEIDGRADLYALGVMLYNMLTGKLPRGIFEMPSALTGGDSDARFDAIILRAMEQDREKRYQSAAEMRQDLDVILTTPKLVAKGTSSSAIPKHELALMRQQMVAKKPLTKRPGPPGHGQKLVVRTVNYVPEKRSVLPAMIAGVLLAAGGFFAWQKFGKKSDATAEASTTASVAASPVASNGQIEGVYVFGGHRYKFFPGPFEKRDLRIMATALRGHLVTINSAEEQKWIEQTFADIISINGNGQCRAGGDRANDGTWSWNTGDPWKFTDWDSGFPSGKEGLSFLVLKYVDGTLKWQNTYWNDHRSAIVEWDDTSTPIPIAALMAALAPAKPAPPDALAFGGHRYKFIGGPTSWNEANEKAASMGGHLVTLTTREEDEWVRRMFVDKLPDERVVHIGGFKTVGSNRPWFWITGEPWAFENWDKGKPDATPDARGVTYRNFGKGRFQWSAAWTPSTKGEIKSGPEAGQYRFEGFVVEWDGGAVMESSPSSPLADAAPATGETLSFGGHRYQFVKEKLKWPEAKARAEAMGGHLATITTQEERDAVSKSAFIPKGEGDQHVFLGGLQETTGGPWTWVTGEPFDMGLWAEGRPDGSGPRLTFYADGKTSSRWDDVHLNSSFPFVVEWDDEKAFLANASKADDSLAFGGHRYQVVRGEVAWEDAKVRAKQMGGHLATLTTLEEDEWVRATFIESLPDEKLLHIGAQRTSETDTWHWITGEPWSYTRWRDKATTSPGGIGYIKAIEGRQRGWSSWDTRKTVIAQSGPLQGKSRVEGFLVEWDEDKGPVLAGGAAAMEVSVKLLDGVDVKRDAVKGQWEIKPEGLVTLLPTAGGSTHQTFEFNRTTPDVYDFEVEFTITEGKGEVWQIFPRSSGPIVWKMGAYTGNPALFGFGPFLDGKNLNDTERTEAATRIPRLKAGEKHRSLVEVRKDSLRALLDGKEVVRWSGDFSRFKFEDTLALKDASHPGVGAYGTGVIFHKAGLRTSSFLSERLAQIEKQFHEAYERDVTKGRAAKAIADLDKKYLAAIDREIAAATKAGSLDDVVALRDEKQRVASNTPLPASDPAGTVAGLKKLRDTYRKSIAPLSKQRDAEIDPVYAHYDAALAAFQTELTKKNQLGDALAVKAKREELDKIRHPAEAAPVLAAAPEMVAAAVKAATPSAGSSSSSKKKSDTKIAVLPDEMLKEAVPTRPFTPAEAAQWALSLGGSARIKKGSGESEVPDVSRIPKGNFTLLSLKVGEKQPLHVVSLAALSGLTELRELVLDNNLITDAGLAFLPKLPKLSRLSVNSCELTDEGLAHIAKQTVLTELNAQNNHITGSGFESLTNLPGLIMLKIGSVDLTDEGIPHLASLGALHKLDLDSGKPLKCENLAPLAGIKKLKTLVLGASATDNTVRSLKSLEKLETLHLYHAPISDYAMDGVAGMKGLKELSLFKCPNLTDIGFTKLVTLKNLVKFDVGHTRLTDAGFQTLSMKLSEVNDLNCASDAMSDAGLTSLTNFRKLGRLVVHVRLCTETGTLQIRRASANLRLISIEQMETLSPARIEAIKKMLPGVDWGKK